MMQGPVSQGLMQRTCKAYSSSGALLHGPCPALAVRDVWAMAVLLGVSHEGCHPTCCPRTDPRRRGACLLLGLSMYPPGQESNA